MEIIELIDSEYTRGTPTAKRDVAVIIFYDGQGNVLLQDRKSITRSGENWGLFGGGIEDGEDPKLAIRRELDEEVAGLPQDLNINPLCKIHNIYFNKLTGNFRELNQNMFAAKLPSDFELEVLEGDGAKWFSVRQLESFTMIPGDREAIKLLAQKNWCLH